MIQFDDVLIVSPTKRRGILWICHRRGGKERVEIYLTEEKL